MILFKRLRELYNKYFKKVPKVPIECQVNEWFATVPKLPQMDNKVLEFTCKECGELFQDSSTRFNQYGIDQKDGEYEIKSIGKTICYKCQYKNSYYPVETVQKRTSTEGILFVDDSTNKDIVKNAFRKPKPTDGKFGKDLKFISEDMTFGK